MDDVDNLDELIVYKHHYTPHNRREELDQYLDLAILEEVQRIANATD